MVERDQSALIQSLRQYFPMMVDSDWVFMENAGGSQIPKPVIDSIAQYMSTNFVQLSANYAFSSAADQAMKDCRAFEEIMMNSKNVGKVVIGSSTSSLVENLANSYIFSGKLAVGDEIIVSDAGHEANRGPWVRAGQKSGATVKHWPVNTQTWETCPLNTLLPLLTTKTKIIAFPHVSNILGECVDVKSIVQEIKSRFPDVIVCVDGVAFAPHSAMDVEDWCVDWYVYSVYKVFGPHFACLFGKNSAFAELQGPNHYFISTHDIPYKFELGGICHELCAGRPKLKTYLLKLAQRPDDAVFDRQVVVDAFSKIEKIEQELMAPLVNYLQQTEKVKLFSSRELRKRFPTISFVHSSFSSREIVAHLHKRKIACRCGHMYAHKLVTEIMGLDEVDGVVRISMLHYNTRDEVQRVLSALQELFD